MERDPTLERHLQELTALNELIRALTTTLDLPAILRIVLDRIKTLTHAEALSLLLYDSQRDELVFAATETLQEDSIVQLRIPPGHGVASWVASTGESAIVNDPVHDPRFYAAIDRVAHFKTRSLLAVPIRRGTEVVAVLELANRYGGTSFSEEDLVKLEAVAAKVEDSIDPYGTPHDAQAMHRVLAAANAVVPSEAASLLVRDPQGRDLVFSASRTLASGVIDGVRLRPGQGIAGWVARHREVVCLDDASKDPRHYTGIQEKTGFTPKAMLCVPMVSKGRLLGVIQAINKFDGSTFDDEEVRLAQTLADHAAIAIENASLYHQAYVASITDDLTGLGNNRHFNRMLPELLHGGGALALIMLDLDNFKQVVDTYGHLAGSRTIGFIGRTIGKLLRPGDVGARFGGDEFVAILIGANATTALRMAEAMRAAVEALHVNAEDGTDIRCVTASVGVALFPEHASTPEDLIRAADEAMYGVKRAGKNAVALARPSGDVAA
jgi:diguanylate cyclase (GGDEF)-like protein